MENTEDNKEIEEVTERKKPGPKPKSQEPQKSEQELELEKFALELKIEEAKLEKERLLQDRQKHLERKAAKQSEERQRKEDARMIPGRLVFHAQPGGVLEFCYRRYKGETLQRYKLKDGEMTELPWGVVRHINENMKVPEYFQNREDGQTVYAIGKYKKRAEFVANIA